MPSYRPIIYHFSSYGSRDPCPDGMSITTALIESWIYNAATNENVLKNITYLICDESSEKGVDLGLALGLGLGLGIPVVAILSFLCYCMFFQDCIESRRRTARIRDTIERLGQSTNNTQLASDVFEPVNAIEINDILVPARHHHFAMDVLDENLKRDIDGLSNEQLIKLLKLARNKYSLRNYISEVLHKRDYGLEII